MGLFSYFFHFWRTDKMDLVMKGLMQGWNCREVRGFDPPVKFSTPIYSLLFFNYHNDVSRALLTIQVIF